MIVSAPDETDADTKLRFLAHTTKIDVRITHIYLLRAMILHKSSKGTSKNSTFLEVPLNCLHARHEMHQSVISPRRCVGLFLLFLFTDHAFAHAEGEDGLQNAVGDGKDVVSRERLHGVVIDIDVEGIWLLVVEAWVAVEEHD